ncbi:MULTISPECIES: 8-amino-7-oxononanoate synthase [Vibrio]|uniref:8-amino-7-oxononanoate synthase n=1 Tax=Vibrio diazotrophicus TaxID=685 RepID=A0A2J8H9A3_VIBDI|nr:MULTISPECIES: 8-amino-7-oxononanoate synthase [Vibrio]MCF7360734.1 8-amino-7-oxononanoate synthase [Vibrio sp. A1-b2]PNH94833.1 8-amino-7-oxononanoate synthase [Vibrio diazotrophicus]PNI05418.1 8-amino-7-oxononanoate synthase [Vibrio diazotrophicus]
MTQQFRARVQGALLERETLGLTRSLQVLKGGNQVSTQCGDTEFINFSSNDYLGLASDKALTRAWQAGLDIYGAGSGASPLVTGFSAAHASLESSLCEWLGYERAVLFGSGFSANQALLFTLMHKEDLLLQDKLNHASLMEAGMLCQAAMKRFKHNDLQHLSQLLSGDQNALVVTEGVFSMDGDSSPLKEIHQLTRNNAWLMVDDAHGVGVLGEDGAGSCNAAGIHPEILVVTFGKAFGLSGAAILCSEEMGNYLTQFARHHVYSTAIPPAQAYAITHAVGMIQTQHWRREKLHELSQVYDELLQSADGYVATSTPIKPFILGKSQQALNVARQLKDKGFWMTAIRPPTVPEGSARLRITLTANHSIEDITALANALSQCMESNK